MNDIRIRGKLMMGLPDHALSPFFLFLPYVLGSEPLAPFRDVASTVRSTAFKL